MTAQPSSQAEREDVAREVLAARLRARGFEEAARGVLNGSVETMLLACLEAMLAFSDREHATPRSMPEEVVEAYERAAKVADAAYNEWSVKRDAAKAGKLRKEHRDFESMALAASIIAAALRAITGASA